MSVVSALYDLWLLGYKKCPLLDILECPFTRKVDHGVPSGPGKPGKPKTYKKTGKRGKSIRTREKKLKIEPGKI